MTAETSNARGEWVLVPRELTDAMLGAAQSAWLNDTLRRTATMWRAMLEAAPRRPAAVDEAKETDLWRCTVCGRVGTVGRCCGEETREPLRRADARGDVPYDRELIARMLDAAEAPAFTKEEMDTQARLLREAAQAKPEARGVVDEAMVERATTAYLQSRGTYEGEVPVDRDDIRAALTAALAQQPAAGAVDEAMVDRACDAYVQIADDCMGLVRRKAMAAALTAALATQHQEPTT